MNESAGLPSTCAASASRPGRMPPLKRLPATRSYPSRSRCDERLELREVVAVVGVAHDHPAAAGGCDPAGQRRAVAALLDRNDTRAELFGDLLEPSVEPLSATTTSPAMPMRSKDSCALRMQIPIVRASFRHGITTESSGSLGNGSAGRESLRSPAELTVASLESFQFPVVGHLGDRNVVISGSLKGFLPPNKLASRVMEQGLLLGGVRAVAGFGFAIGDVIVVIWVQPHFGALSEERRAILAATVMVVGIQIFFSSPLSVIGLRRVR